MIALVELNKTLLEQEAEIERLTEECSSMSQKLSKDPEFIRFVDTVYAVSNQAVHLTQEFLFFSAPRQNAITIDRNTSRAFARDRYFYERNWLRLIASLRDKSPTSARLVYDIACELK